MTALQIKELIKEIIAGKLGQFERISDITEDDQPKVLLSVDPKDNSTGTLEVRYAAATIDTTLVGISGIKRVPYTKEGGIVTLGTVTDVEINAGSGIMAASDFTLAASAGTIEGTGTGATQQVNWEILKIFNGAQAPEIALP